MGDNTLHVCIHLGIDHSHYAFTIVNFCSESNREARQKTFRNCVFINAKVYTFNYLQTEQIEHALCIMHVSSHARRRIVSGLEGWIVLGLFAGLDWAGHS